MTPNKFRPFVPESMQMKEFTWRAVLLGLVMCVVLGAANAYLGLKAGQTIAATYPAAVIGMAVLAYLQGLDSRREHRAYRRLDRRIRGRGRGLHAACLRHGQGLGVVRFARGLLEIHRAHAGRQRPRRALRVADPARDGGRSRTAFPGIRGGQRSPQGRTGHRQNRQVSLLQHRLRRGHISGRRLRLLRARPGLLLPHRRARQERAPPGPPRQHPHRSHRRRHHRRRAQRQPGLHRRRLHHRAGTRRAQFLRQRDRLGTADSAPHLLPGTADSNLPARRRAATKTGSASPPPSGATSCAPSRSAA